jgi:putative CocE/NonD family hydrolase
VNEGKDGYDTIEWAASQPWSTGRIGTIGGSYGGWNQWLAAVEEPEHLKAMVSIVTPPDPFLNVPYQNGAFLLGMVDWMILVDGRSMQDLGANDLPMLYRHLPVSSTDEAAGRHSLWWGDWIKHNTYDEYWKRVSYQDKYNKVKAPALHITGWYDDDQVGGTMNFPAMIAHGGSPEARAGQRLLIGPWPHGLNRSRKLGDIDFGPDAVIDINGVYLKWFDCQLKQTGCDRLASEAPVRIFIMGDNRWRDEREWPLARAKVTPYYLHSEGHANTAAGDGRLSTTPPASEPQDHYKYDPNDATPFVLIPGALQLGTTEDQRAVEARSDVLVFTTEPMQEDLEVTGPVRVTLFAASSAPDTDWTGKLVDVHPDGYSQRLLDGIIRARFRESFEHPSFLKAGKVYEYKIDLWSTSNVFKKGHRIRLEIASAAFPKFSRNLNNGEKNEASTSIRVADQTIYHDSEHQSHVLLHVIPRSNGKDTASLQQ